MDLFTFRKANQSVKESREKFHNAKEKMLTAMQESPGLLHCHEHGSPQNVLAISSETPHLLTTVD